VSPRAKPADVRFYVDADLLGIAKILAGLRPDITYPGDPGATIHRRQRPACPVASPAVLDTEWIPVVAQAGWLIVTRDSRIQDHRAEIAAVRDNDAKMVALSGREATNTWSQLEIVFAQWRRIEPLVDEDGPFIFAATRSGLRRISLD
jgi:hypothetical protein